MAEKCLRPGDEEDADEEGEEAAEAPVRVGQVVIEKDESTDEDEYEEAAVADSPPPPPPGEAEEAAVPDSPPPPRAAEKPAIPASPAPKSPPLPPPEPSYPSPPPAVPEVPSYPPLMSVYPTVSPAFYPMPPSVSGMNLFANDGSFMELFKKKMEASSAGSKEESEVPEEKKPEPDKRKPVSFVRTPGPPIHTRRLSDYKSQHASRLCTLPGNAGTCSFTAAAMTGVLIGSHGSLQDTGKAG